MAGWHLYRALGGFRVNYRSPKLSGYTLLGIIAVSVLVAVVRAMV